MRRSDAIMAAIEQRHAQVLGERPDADFQRAFRQVAQLQRAWRDTTRQPS
jgi:hypothetical protein